MQKTYTPNILYLIKIFGLIVSVVFSIVIISIFFDIIGYFIQSSWFELAIIIIALILLLIGSYFAILSNNPIIKFQDHYMTIGSLNVEYDQITGFFPSKGGSEPFILTSSGNRIDIQLSWFSKKDRVEIVNTIKENIT